MVSSQEQQLRERLDKQIGRTLAIQALVPLVSELLPSEIVELSFVFDWPWQVSIYVCLMYIWLPVANPLATMFVVRPYRRAIAEWVGGKAEVATSTEPGTRSQ